MLSLLLLHVPDGVSECGLSELPSSIHSDDETEHEAFFVQTCVEEVENAEYVAPPNPVLSMRVEDPLDEELDPRSRLREYVDSRRRLVAKKLCYAKPTRSSWPLKQGRMGDLSQLKEGLEQKITSLQREVDLKLMKSVWGAHVGTPEEDDLSEECVCEPPRACLCCHRPPEMVERDLLYAYQGLKDTTKGGESLEHHLQTSITQGASNLHSDDDMEDTIKLLDPRVQTLMKTYLEVFRELPPPASCDKLVQMDLKLKPEFLGHKIRRKPYPAPKEQVDEIERQIQECIDAGLVLDSWNHQRKHPEPTETPSATPATPAPSTTPETPWPTSNQHKKPPNDHVTPKALHPRQPPTCTENHHRQHSHHRKHQHHQQ